MPHPAMQASMCTYVESIYQQISKVMCSQVVISGGASYGMVDNFIMCLWAHKPANFDKPIYVSISDN